MNICLKARKLFHTNSEGMDDKVATKKSLIQQFHQTQTPHAITQPLAEATTSYAQISVKKLIVRLII
jgi:hypothetical protein